MVLLSWLLTGVIFGLGLAVSGLINPQKVLDFLNVTGPWDPSLILTMGFAVVLSGFGYWIATKWRKPVACEKFNIPSNTTIDKKLIIGAGLFGIGWGLVGYCPGPAVTSLVYQQHSTYIFVACMLLGMVIGKVLKPKI